MKPVINHTKLNTRLIKRHDDLAVSSHKNIPIIDSDFDHTVNKSSYVVNYFTGITFDVDDTLTDMKSPKPLHVVHKCIKCVNFTTCDTKYTKILLKLNQCILDSNPG